MNTLPAEAKRVFETLNQHAMQQTAGSPLHEALCDALALIGNLERHASVAAEEINRLTRHKVDLMRRRASEPSAERDWSDEYPRSQILTSALVVSTEIDEEDEGSPRRLEVRLSDEAPGLIVVQNLDHEDHTLAFFVGQWPVLRHAVDVLAYQAAEPYSDSEGEP